MKKLILILSLLIIATMVLVACGTNLQETEAPAAEEEAPAVEEDAEAPAEEAEAPEEEAPAEEAEMPEELLFVAINKSADQQYFIDLQNSFVDTTVGFGAEALKFDAKLDPSLGVSLVNDAISAGATGISITVPDQTIGPAIAQAARDAGVVLIATDDGIVDENGDPVPFVGFDGKDMGKKVGE